MKEVVSIIKEAREIGLGHNPKGINSSANYLNINM